MANTTRWARRWVVAIAFALSLTLPAVAKGQDIYVLYCGGTKNDMRSVTEALGENLRVKTYNVGLLSLADYSGKQKAVARFNRARLVVVVGEKTLKPLKNVTLTPPVILLDAAETSLTSRSRLLSVVPEEAVESQRLQENATVLQIRKPEDLADEAVAKADALVVHGMPSTKAAAVVATRMLDTQN